MLILHSNYYARSIVLRKLWTVLAVIIFRMVWFGRPAKESYDEKKKIPKERNLNSRFLSLYWYRLSWFRFSLFWLWRYYSAISRGRSQILSNPNREDPVNIRRCSPATIVLRWMFVVAGVVTYYRVSSRCENLYCIWNFCSIYLFLYYILLTIEHKWNGAAARAKNACGRICPSCFRFRRPLCVAAYDGRSRFHLPFVSGFLPRARSYIHVRSPRTDGVHVEVRGFPQSRF